MKINAAELDFIMSDVRAGARRLPCSSLRRTLAKGRTVRPAAPVLLLAAMLRNLLASWTIDLADAGHEFPPIDAWLDDWTWPKARVVQGRMVVVPSAKTMLPQLRVAGRPILASVTCQMLAGMPVPLAQAMVQWAPPLVLETPSGWVLRGHLPSAWVARTVLSSEPIRVVKLDPEHWRPEKLSTRTLASMCSHVLPQLVRLCHGRGQIVAAAAETEAGAAWASGLERAMTYRHLRRVRGAKGATKEVRKT